MTGVRGPAPAGEIVGIQYLRGLAAAMVVVAHLSGQVARRVPGSPDLTPLMSGVDVFFVISGFVMAYSTAEGRALSARAFLVRRLVRVVPLYWLATAFMVAMLLVAPQAVQTAVLDWRHVACSFLFVPARHPVFPDRHLPLLIPGWTINFEMFFYATFAGAMWLGAKRVGSPMALVAAALTALALVGLVARPAGVAGFYTDGLMLEFLLGIGVAAIVRRGARLPAMAAALLATVSLTLLVLPGGGVQFIRVGLPAAALVFAGAAARASDWRPLAHLGDASYSLYLSHVFTVSAVAQAAARIGLMGTPAGRVAFMAGGLAACIAVALLCWFYVERPLTRYLRHRLNDRGKPFASEARAGSF